MCYRRCLVEMAKIADQISLGNTLEFVRPKAGRLLRRKRAQMLQQGANGANGYTARATTGKL